jgi:spore coat protein A
MTEIHDHSWSLKKLLARGRAEAMGTGARKLAAAALLAAAVMALPGPAVAGSPPLAKFVDPLPIPSVFTPVATGAVTEYEVDMMQVQQQLHRDLPPTTLWTYNGVFPGPSFEARQGEIVKVTWTSSLPTTHILPVDNTLPDTVHGEPDVRTVVHRHGGLQDAIYDGGPEDWFTPGFTEMGATFATNVYYYPNTQPAATLWYHDHAAGVTRLNVYAGLAGFYLLRDDEEDALGLPSGDYEIPIVIQDRTFNDDGSLFYPSKGRWPKLHPVWVKHFHGDTAVVNGKVWPYLDVEPRKYRFRVLNGSNARLYNLYFSNDQRFYQIGTDTGLMMRPVRSNDLDLAPGERADIVVDFSGMEGQTIRLLNAEGDDGPDLVDIMEFRVGNTPVVDDSNLPSFLRVVETYDPDDALVTRELTVEVSMDEHGDPIAFLLDGKYRHEGVTEIAQAGSIEVWRLLNLTSETHPIHLHLSDFQVLSRQEFEGESYGEALEAFRNGEGPKPVLEDYLGDEVNGPTKNERGNKDTVQAHGESVTTIVVKFGEYTGDTVWHCHILEHEDNDMMRPLRVVPVP